MVQVIQGMIVLVCNGFKELLREILQRVSGDLLGILTIADKKNRGQFFLEGGNMGGVWVEEVQELISEGLNLPSRFDT